MIERLFFFSTPFLPYGRKGVEDLRKQDRWCFGRVCEAAKSRVFAEMFFVTTYPHVLLR